MPPPVLALIIASDTEAADSQRAVASKADRLRQISVATLDRDGRIPLADQIAATVILGKNTPKSLARPYLSGSGRSGCDIGAFPANKLLYSPPNACACQLYLPGNKVYHGRPVRPALPSDQRLEKGIAQPAPLADDDASGWPMWRRDPARSLWQTGNFPTRLKPIWHRRNEMAPPNEMLEKAWQSDGVIRAAATRAIWSGDFLRRRRAITSQ